RFGWEGLSCPNDGIAVHNNNSHAIGRTLACQETSRVLHHSRFTAPPSSRSAERAAGKFHDSTGSREGKSLSGSVSASGERVRSALWPPLETTHVIWPLNRYNACTPCRFLLAPS